MSHKGSLTKADKELIAVAVSGSNGCVYCVVAHSAFHRMISRDPHKADQVMKQLLLNETRLPTSSCPVIKTLNPENSCLCSFVVYRTVKFVVLYFSFSIGCNKLRGIRVGAS